MTKEDEILNFWESMADTHGMSYSATIPDKYLKDIELQSIKNYLHDGMRVLDVGCGNGYSCFVLKKHFDIEIKGIDYSEKMITLAKSAQKEQSGLFFSVDNVVNLSEESHYYDAVISERCIINLPKWEKQKQAIKELWRVLKPDGLLILSEAFVEPLERLNKLRNSIGLESIKQKWHNRYMLESELFSCIDKLFSTESIQNYASTYYFLTRLVSPKMGEIEHRETSYFDPINEIASSLPPIGDYGPQKTIILKKIKNAIQSAIH